MTHEQKNRKEKISPGFHCLTCALSKAGLCPISSHNMIRLLVENIRLGQFSYQSIQGF